jgi:hypothetical protein
METIRCLIHRDILYAWNFNAFLIIQYLMLSACLFYMLSMPYSNCNSDVVKWRASGKCHVEMAVGKTKRWVMYFSTFKLLPLSLIECHSKGDIGRKSFAAEFEGNSKLDEHNCCLNYILSGSNNFRFSAVFVEATTGGQGMLPYSTCFPWFLIEQHCQILRLAFFFFFLQHFRRNWWNHSRLLSLPKHKLPNAFLETIRLIV